MERAGSLKFLVLLDGKLCWKEHFTYIENEIAKDNELLYKVV